MISCNVAPVLPLIPSDMSAVMARDGILHVDEAARSLVNTITLGTRGGRGGGGRAGLLRSAGESDVSSFIFGVTIVLLDRGGLAGGTSSVLFETGFNFTSANCVC